MLREAQTLASELVDTRCRRTTQLAAAIRTQITIANVVGKDQYDVGFLCVGRLCRGCCECQCANERDGEEVL